ncbi:MAG: MarR family transcriptional regulator [Bradyrhizobium sp.]
MKAPRAPNPEKAADGRLEHVCQTAIDGRRAVRKLTQWAECFELSESELQILSCLSGPVGAGLDQTTLATALSYSAPQVSACVEKLRVRGLIAQDEAPGDRRRRMWRLSADGVALLQRVKAAGESREAAA